jgi:hypothetical protein
MHGTVTVYMFIAVAELSRHILESRSNHIMSRDRPMFTLRL